MGAKDVRIFVGGELVWEGIIDKVGSQGSSCYVLTNSDSCTFLPLFEGWKFLNGFKYAGGSK